MVPTAHNNPFKIDPPYNDKAQPPQVIPPSHHILDPAKPSALQSDEPQPQASKPNRAARAAVACPVCAPPRPPSKVPSPIHQPLIASAKQRRESVCMRVHSPVATRYSPGQSTEDDMSRTIAQKLHTGVATQNAGKLSTDGICGSVIKRGMTSRPRQRGKPSATEGSPVAKLPLRRLIQ